MSQRVRAIWEWRDGGEAMWWQSSRQRSHLGEDEGEQDEVE
jgi:hypothetical protein